MNGEPIELGKICVYIGPNPGRLLKHRVIESCKERVITWSLHPSGEISGDGYSWMGDRESFCKHFRPCLPSEL
jgi:hypothetical protein